MIPIVQAADLASGSVLSACSRVGVERLVNLRSAAILSPGLDTKAMGSSACAVPDASTISNLAEHSFQGTVSL